MTLNQTGKLDHKIPIVLFGTDYWSKILNLEAMVEEGKISPEDLDSFYRTDSIDEAFKFVVDDLSENAMDIPGMIL